MSGLVNSFLAGRDSQILDPSCNDLIRDLEEVSWTVDATGAAGIEPKKSDRHRTHARGALGYFISQAFPSSLQ